uniref:Uncharacterized protein n=1 Tax=Lepeophtheirus salmonis TaxID=72036 RepID=A0A0K2TXG7_LEPSM
MSSLANDFFVAPRTIGRPTKHKLGLVSFTRTPTPPSDRGHESQEARKVEEHPTWNKAYGAVRFLKLINSTTVGTTAGVLKQKNRSKVFTTPNIRPKQLSSALRPLMERRYICHFSRLDRKSAGRPTITCLDTPSFYD